MSLSDISAYQPQGWYKSIAANTFTTTGSSITSGTLVAKDMVTSAGDLMAVDGADYRELQEDSKMLYALIDAGVEDWEGYNNAIALLRENDGRI